MPSSSPPTSDLPSPPCDCDIDASSAATTLSGGATSRPPTGASPPRAARPVIAGVAAPAPAPGASRFLAAAAIAASSTGGRAGPPAARIDSRMSRTSARPSALVARSAPTAAASARRPPQSAAPGGSMGSSAPLRRSTASRTEPKTRARRAESISAEMRPSANASIAVSARSAERRPAAAAMHSSGHAYSGSIRTAGSTSGAPTSRTLWQSTRSMRGGPGALTQQKLEGRRSSTANPAVCMRPTTRNRAQMISTARICGGRAWVKAGGGAPPPPPPSPPHLPHGRLHARGASYRGLEVLAHARADERVAVVVGRGHVRAEHRGCDARGREEARHAGLARWRRRCRRVSHAVLAPVAVCVCVCGGGAAAGGGEAGGRAYLVLERRRLVPVQQLHDARLALRGAAVLYAAAPPRGPCHEPQPAGPVRPRRQP